MIDPRDRVETLIVVCGACACGLILFALGSIGL